jgi:hypothetical protein
MRAATSTPTHLLLQHYATCCTLVAEASDHPAARRFLKLLAVDLYIAAEHEQRRCLSRHPSDLLTSEDHGVAENAQPLRTTSA